MRGGEAAEELLGFAEAVSKKYGRLFVLEGGATEGGDVGEDFFRRRKHVVRAAEGGLHDEDVGVRGGAGLGGEAGAEFEIAGVEERAVVGVGEEALGGAVDVAGGVERDGGVGRELFGVAEGNYSFAAFGGHAGAHEAGGAFGAEDFFVRREVVEVGVRNEGAFDGMVSVEPPVDLREVEAVAELDFPRGHFLTTDRADGHGWESEIGGRGVGDLDRINRRDRMENGGGRKWQSGEGAKAGGRYFLSQRARSSDTEGTEIGGEGESELSRKR